MAGSTTKPLLHLQFLTTMGVQRADGIRPAAVSNCLVSASISFAAGVAPSPFKFPSLDH